MLAWVLLVLGHVTGTAQHMDHDAVFHAEAPPSVALCLFLVGWLLMVMAMMAPPMFPALRRLETAAGGPPSGLLTAFLAGFVFVWAIAGSAALGFDMIVHEAVHAVPALEERPRAVAAALLAAAGLAQLAPSTRRQLARCGRSIATGSGRLSSAFIIGREYGARCLRADGPLMLVMFAAGGALSWMVILTIVMMAERSPRDGDRVAVGAGVALLVGALLVVLNPAWVPAPLGGER